MTALAPFQTPQALRLDRNKPAIGTKQPLRTPWNVYRNLLSVPKQEVFSRRAPHLAVIESMVEESS